MKQQNELIATNNRADLLGANELRKQLAAVSTPSDALGVRDKAERMREAYKLMNRSVGECNQFSEIYMLATWRFGDIVSGIGRGAPEGNQNAKR